MYSWKKWVLIGVLLYFSKGASAHHRETYEVFSVAFYNVENLFDPADDPYKKDEDFTPGGPYRYTEEVYREKRRNIAAVLSQLGKDVSPAGPALIGLAEIEQASVLDDLIREPALREAGYRYVHFESPDSRGIDVALLYRPADFRVLHARALPVDFRVIGRKGKTRDILYVCGILRGDTVHVMVNHWPSRRGGTKTSAPLRLLAAEVCKKLSDSLQRFQRDTKILVMGDFNDNPANASIRTVLQATGEKRKVAQGMFYNPWVSFYQKGIGTLAHEDRWQLFDQILLSGSWLAAAPRGRWQYIRAEIYNRDFLKQHSGRYKGYPYRSFQNRQWSGGYSDHFPVIIYLGRPLP